MTYNVDNELLLSISKIIKNAFILFKSSFTLSSNYDIKYLIVLDEFVFERFKLFNYQDLKNIGIHKPHLITSKGQEECDIVIYFVAPILDNIRLINKFSELLNKKNFHCHIVFSSIYISENISDSLKNYHNDTKFYHKIPLSMFNYDEDVIVLSNNYYNYNQGSTLDFFSDTQDTINYLFNSFDIRNNMIISLGKNSLSIGDKLSCDFSNNNYSTILCDRELDLISLMKLPISCGGIINETLGIHYDTIKIGTDKDIKNINIKKLIFKKIRYMNIQEANKEIKIILADMFDKIEVIKNQISQSILNIKEEDKAFIRDIESNKSDCMNMITLFSHLINIQTSENYVIKMQCEELIEKSLKLTANIIDLIVKIIKQGDLITGLRYLILYNQYNNGITEYECNKLLTCDIQNQFEEWSNILKYLKRQKLLKIASIDTTSFTDFGGYLMGLLKNNISYKSLNNSLFSNIVEAETSSKVISITKKYSENFDYSIMTATNETQSIKLHELNLVVVIIGGLTIDEIRDMKQNAKKIKKNILIVTDKIITASSYINDIMIIIKS